MIIICEKVYNLTSYKLNKTIFKQCAVIYYSKSSMYNNYTVIYSFFCNYFQIYLQFEVKGAISFNSRLRKRCVYL